MQYDAAESDWGTVTSSGPSRHFLVELRLTSGRAQSAVCSAVLLHVKYMEAIHQARVYC